MRTSIVLALSMAILAACATPAEQAAMMNREVDRMIVVYGPACEKLGYKNDTDLWRNCVLQMSTKDDFDRYHYYPSYHPTWRY
ncbi:MAG TPA: hypothetical protein VJZ27_11270 [Aggregatilineales bacterium]|nr:hypothetical protein [Aggregatilineales bacterium]